MVDTSGGSGSERTHQTSNRGDGAAPAPRQRAVILGASNVIRNVSTVIATAERFRGEPLDLLVATGHGRSYGQTSRVLGRALPAITTCDLWDALARQPQANTVSLLTDIGNDLLYGASVDAIASWVEQCLARLKKVSAQLILTELPLENVARLNFAKFFLIRSILFPQSRLTLVEAREMSCELNERLKVLASRYDATVVKPESGWYGADPIHIHRRHRASAWESIMQPWQTETSAGVGATRPGKRILSISCRPHVRWLWGMEQRRAQPSLRLPSGTRVSFF